MCIQNSRMLRRYVKIVSIQVLIAALQPLYTTHRFQRMSEKADSVMELKVLSIFDVIMRGITFILELHVKKCRFQFWVE
jgi:hypothetical protein